MKPPPVNVMALLAPNSRDDSLPTLKSAEALRPSRRRSRNVWKAGLAARQRTQSSKCEASDDVAVAGELAIELGILPWRKGEASKFVEICFEDWRREYEAAESENDLLGVPEALFYTLPDQFSVAYENGNEITNSSTRAPFLGYAVLVHKDGELSRLYINPYGFDEEVRKRGKSGREIVRAFREAGRLYSEKKDGKRRLKTRIARPQRKGMSNGPFYALAMLPDAMKLFEAGRK